MYCSKKIMLQFAITLYCNNTAITDYVDNALIFLQVD